ncbi:MAG: electron transfer flavoprotein subunit alpha [Actinomycetota bacterium]
MAVKVTKKCIGCGVCVDVCPYSALELFEGQAIVSGHCTVCGACAEICPVDAIVIEGTASEGLAAQTKTDWSGIWVLAETDGGNIAPVALELLHEADQLAAELKEPVSAILIGSGVTDLAKTCAANGASKVYVVDNEAMKNNLVEPMTRVLVDIISREKPAVLLAGATVLGRTLMPAAAAVLETGLTADCTALAIDTETKLLRQTRPTFGGNLMATIICPERRPQMATVRPHVFKKGEPDSSRTADTVQVKLDPALFASKITFVDKHTELAADEKLEDAEVIVAGGRGMGKPENLQILNELAKLFHGAVGSSRPLVDEGWLPYVHQVGQTGKTVCPKLYLACGISGAIQHAAGMATSEVIVAVNRDADAPIFDLADYGIVGDVNEVLPALLERLKKERA